jgi:hypothetical protein
VQANPWTFIPLRFKSWVTLKFGWTSNYCGNGRKENFTYLLHWNCRSKWVIILKLTLNKEWFERERWMILPQDRFRWRALEYKINAAYVNADKFLYHFLRKFSFSIYLFIALFQNQMR